MGIVLISYNVLLFGSIAFAAIFGGRTGKAAALIFCIANNLSIWATSINPDWKGTSYSMMSVDCLCFLALMVLAMTSNRYWPIWALGLQLISVVTHVATIIDPLIFPGIYDSLSGFWSIPILLVMVWGTILDRKQQSLDLA
jgi:hypothetical protein